MPSSCPKCHAVLEEDEICCAQVRYTWKCRECHKLSSGVAVPYGRCFLCGGQLEVLEGRDLGDAMRFRVVRDALQFELNAFHFYKAACDQVKNGRLKFVCERLYEAELDHLHEIEEKYHVHLDRDWVAESPAWLVRDLAITDATPLRRVYQQALDMERRTWDYFRNLANELPDGTERDLCLEFAAEELEHVALIEGEIEQLTD